MQQVLQSLPVFADESKVKRGSSVKKQFGRCRTGGSVSEMSEYRNNPYIPEVAACLIDWCAALWAAFTGNDPYGVSTL